MAASAMPEWLSIAETVVKILAVLFAGGWAIFLLAALQKIATSRAQLDNLNAERDKSVTEVQKIQRETQLLDRTLKAQPVIRAKISTSTEKSLQGGWLLFATLELENTGNAPARLVHEDDPFLVTKVDFDENGRPIFRQSKSLAVPQARDPQARALATIVRAGGRESLPLAIHLESPGLYLLTFRAQLCSEDRETLEELDIPEWRPISWTAKRYVNVE